MSTGLWMPIYIGDYLGKTGRLNTQQHGAYLLLMFDYWRNGPPPMDDVVLAQITRLSIKSWKSMKNTIMTFFEVRGHHLHHGRLEEELRKASNCAERRVEKAKKGAQSRWSKHRNDDAPSMLQALPVECAIHTHISKKESKKENKLVGDYAFFGQTIKLAPRHLDEWRRLFHSIQDIEAELSVLDGWWQRQPEGKRSEWFHATKSMMNKKHQRLLAEKKEQDFETGWDGISA